MHVIERSQWLGKMMERKKVTHNRCVGINERILMN